MNIKQLLFISLLSLGSMMILNYFFPPKAPVNSQEELVERGSFINIVNRPSLTEKPSIDFTFENREEETLLGEDVFVIGKDCNYVFNTNGAVLKEWFFKKNNESIPIYLNGNASTFLIAIDSYIPLNYTLEENYLNEAKQIIVFSAKSEKYFIKKTYIIDINNHLINLSCDVKLELPSSLKLIIETPSPVNNYDENFGFVYGLDGKINKPTKNFDIAVFPSQAGLHNNYFLIGLINDKDSFSERCFFTEENKRIDSLYLESKKLNNISFSLTFYAGSKEYSSINKSASLFVPVLNLGFFGRLNNLFSWLVHALGELITSYGLVIILIALLVRLILGSISYYTRGADKLHAEFIKKYKFVEEKYKDDPERKKMEEELLLKKYGAMPGASKLLAPLLQTLFFFIIRKVIVSSVWLYKTPFLWITDLSSPDNYAIFSILFGIGLIGGFLPTKNTFQPQHQFAIFIAMIFFSVLSSYWSAGLVIYISCAAFFNLMQVKILGIK